MNWKGISRWLCLWLFVWPVTACDLCAVSNARTAGAEESSGFAFSLSEQFIRNGALQFSGQSLPPSFLDEGYLDNSITHLVPGYNFSSRFGISLNVPIVYREFKRFELQPAGVGTEEGNISGVGDTSLIARWTALQKSTMKHSFSVNLLAGIKFPTGDTERIRNEVAKAEAFRALLGGTGHQHELGGVHEHDLSLGSGSYDAIAGVNLQARWDRWFFSSLMQYYARTEGEAGFSFSDELMISGGPGAFVLLTPRYTVSVQANAGYETRGRDEYVGVKSSNTGLTAWYLGPLVNVTWGGHFSGNVAVDIPIRIANAGLQNVPEYRIHGGVSWRF